jgi:hypothetical protein
MRRWSGFDSLISMKHLEVVNTDLMMDWCLKVTYFHMSINKFITFVDPLISI